MRGALRAFWTERSERERWMLGIMLALLAIVFVWLGVIRPLDAADRRAQARLDAATADAGAIAAADGVLRAARTAVVPPSDTPLPVIVGSAASAAGFEVARLDPLGSDRVAVAIASARSPALFGWLRTLDGNGVIVETMKLRTNSDATLAVEATFQARAR